MSQFNRITHCLVQFSGAFFAVLALSVNAQSTSNSNAVELSSAAELNSIESISASRLAAGEVVVKIGMRNAVSVPPEIFSIEQRERLTSVFQTLPSPAKNAAPRAVVSSASLARTFSQW